MLYNLLNKGCKMKSLKLNEIENKLIIGRNVKDVEKKESIVFFWSGSGIKFKLKTSEIWAVFNSSFDSHESFVFVLINGQELSRFSIKKGTHSYCIARNLSSEKENEIMILKDTQPMSGDKNHLLEMSEVCISDNTEFLPVPKNKINIEFIGDSITSGEGLYGGKDEMDWISSWMSSVKSYGFSVAKELNADFRLISQCGWGIISGWDNNVNNAIPKYYEEVCSVMNSDLYNQKGGMEKYNFDSWHSDFVVVNLGTNDNSAFNSPSWHNDADGKDYKLKRLDNGDYDSSDVQKVQDSVIEFLKLIRKNNPSAKIIWVCGMIPIQSMPSFIKKAIKDYIQKTGDNSVYFLTLDSMDKVEKKDIDKGSRGHPGRLTHEMAAKKIIKFIKKI